MANFKILSGKSLSLFRSSSLKISIKHAVSVRSVFTYAKPSSSRSAVPQVYQKPKAFKELFRDPTGKVRAACLFSSAVVLLILATWQGTHMYIEHYLHSTNPALSSEVRTYLRGAYIREEVKPDPAIALKYLELAREKILEEKQLDPNTLEFVKINIRIAKAHKLRKQYLQAIDFYVEAWQILSRQLSVIEKDKQSLELQSLIDLGLEIGQLYLNLDQLPLAKEYFSKGFQIAESLKPQNAENKKMSVEYRLGLGSVYAKEGEYSTALDLYFSALEDIELANSDKQQLHPWGCIESIATGYIAEVTYAKTKNTQDAISWAWKAHSASQPFQDQTLAGDASGAIALTTLGHLYKKTGNLSQAQACYSKAVLLADRALDSDLTRSIALYLGQLQPQKIKDL